jgi:hypothetical protein
VTGRDPLDPKSAALLGEWHGTATLASERHSTACDYYAALDRFYGTSSTVLTAIVGSAVFISLTKSTSTGLRVAAGVVGVIAAILSAVQTGAKYAAQSERHRTASRAYGALGRQMEEIQAIGLAAGGDVQTELDTINKTMNDIGQTAPNVPPRIWFNRGGVWRLFAAPKKTAAVGRGGAG